MESIGSSISCRVKVASNLDAVIRVGDIELTAAFCVVFFAYVEE